jgi:hypothetical protein
LGAPASPLLPKEDGQAKNFTSASLTLDKGSVKSTPFPQSVGSYGRLVEIWFVKSGFEKSR